LPWQNSGALTHSNNSLNEKFPDVAHAILDIVADNARRFLLTGKRFVTLVHSSDPAINLEPVGATPVLWNPKESLNSKRGL
jgi:hypothetical protein